MKGYLLLKRQLVRHLRNCRFSFLTLDQLSRGKTKDRKDFREYISVKYYANGLIFFLSCIKENDYIREMKAKPEDS